MLHPAIMPDDAFLDAFLDGRLDPASFTHREHVRASWLLVRRLPLERAIDQACMAIARMAQRAGAPGKFHRTLSVAFMRVIASRPAAASWEDFLAANADLVMDGRRVLARYYSDTLLHSLAARENFLPPDRDPLP